MIFLLTVSLLLLTCIVLWILATRKNHWIHYLLIPFLLFNIGFTWHTVDDILGQATEQLPQGKVHVVAVHVAKPHIYVVVRHQDNDEPTFHKIPYSKRNKDEIDAARQQMKKGVRMVAEFKEDDSQKTVQFFKWDHLENIPK